MLIIVLSFIDFHLFLCYISIKQTTKKRFQNILEWRIHMKYSNPIVPGFYPDPSIIRVDDTYYMVCSSFQYFPGVPLLESKDLINWKQIGNVLTRESQLPLDNAHGSEGIFAPTIRYNNGRFYMVTTNVSMGGNFYVYTDDIYGEWSEPIFVEQDGIDPSLYFEDGHCYFMSNGTDDQGKGGIIQCEIDIETGKKLSPSQCIWNGTGGRFLEGPHLYKIRDYYYLLASEGGTEYGHMLVYARSKDKFGPFEPYADNPVLTNRNKGGYQLQACGHGDIVEDTNGNFWMVHLAFRQIHQWVMHHTTGREVYLVPVTFREDGWFEAGENGCTLLEFETDRLPENLVQNKYADYALTADTPSSEWMFIRKQRPDTYTFKENAWTLKASADSLDSVLGSPTFVGIRQQEMNFTISCDVTVDNEEAGITMYMTEQQHYEVGIRKKEHGYEAFRRRHVGDLIVEDFITPLPCNTATLQIQGEPLSYHFYVTCNETCYDFDFTQSKYLSTEIAGNFTGVMMGLYAQNGESASKGATFSNLKVKY